MTIHRVKLKDLDTEYIQQLKSDQNDGETEVSIWISGSKNMMSDEQFWGIISMFDWTEDNSKDVIQAAVLFLKQMSVKEIKAFENTLSKKLYQLDGLEYAKNTDGNAYKGEGQSFSSDVFLYARCAVVAKGKKVFDNIIEQPETMLKNETFEQLLSLSNQAYKLKTEKEFDYIPAYIYETFANAEGWGNKGLLENIFN